MNKPYFESMTFYDTGIGPDCAEHAAMIANEKIQPLLEKLERYDKCLTRIKDGDYIDANDYCECELAAKSVLEGK